MPTTVIDVKDLPFKLPKPSRGCGGTVSYRKGGEYSSGH